MTIQNFLIIHSYENQIERTFFSFFLPCTIISTSIFSLDRVDLVNTCNSGNGCLDSPWIVTDSFQNEFVGSETAPENAKSISKPPIVIQKIFPETKSFNFTLRKEFLVPSEYLKENVHSGIYLDAIGDVYSIYLNGKFIGSEGKIDEGKVVYSRYGNRIKFPLNFANFKVGKNILIIHIQGSPKFNLTGLFRANGYYLDDYNTIIYESRDRTGLILIFLYLFFGLYHIFLYFKRKHERYNLAFSIVL